MVPRAVPIVEAMAALVLIDACLLQLARLAAQLPPVRVQALLSRYADADPASAAAGAAAATPADPSSR